MNAITYATMKTIQKRDKGSLVMCMCFRLHYLSEQGIWLFIQTYVINYFKHNPCLFFSFRAGEWNHTGVTVM